MIVKESCYEAALFIILLWPLSCAMRIDERGYNPLAIAVELNEEILPKAEYAETVLKDGDVLEIVNFVGGG